MNQNQQDNIIDLQKKLDNIDRNLKFLKKADFRTFLEKPNIKKCFDKLKEIENKLDSVAPTYQDISKAKEIFDGIIYPCWKKTKTFPEFESKKEYRILSCWLDFPENNPEIYILFLKNLSAQKKIQTSILKNLIFVYFNKFNLFVNNDSLFFSIKEVLQNPKINNPRLEWLLKNKDIYFSQDAPYQIAQIILENRKNTNQNINELLKDYTRDYQGDLFSEILKRIGLKCFENIENPFYLNILLEEILVNPYIDQVQLYELVSKIILAFDSDSDLTSETREKIRKTLLLHEKFGDPRIKDQNWKLIDEKARKVFKNWLAKVDIEFFFKVIFDDISDEQKRMAFWLKYIKQVIESRVIICADHKYKNATELQKAEKEGRTFAEFNNSDASCFIMKLGFNKSRNVIYIVEFSNAGKALYLYKDDSLQFDFSKNYIYEKDLRDEFANLVKVGDIFERNYEGSYYLKNDLNKLELKKILKFYHHRDIIKLNKNEEQMKWHAMVEAYLSNNLGIYPN